MLTYSLPAAKVDLGYSYLDVEIDAEVKIFRFGLVSPLGSWDLDATQAGQVQAHLRFLCQNQRVLCGHNIRRFDLPHITRQWVELKPLRTIDTLELSLLAFPLEVSHDLLKDDKPSQYASNTLLENAQATQLLFQQILQALDNQPLSLQRAYAYLLTCGVETADLAYENLFQKLGLLVETLPAMEQRRRILNELPEEAIAGMHHPALEEIWKIDEVPDDGIPDFSNLNCLFLKYCCQTVEQLPFDTRLCFAALLAFNYERHRTQSKQGPCVWLSHLPDFQILINILFPVITRGFTYQLYLREFGISSFRPHQEEAVQAILARKYPLILLPTGGGKSLCYQLPALMFHRRQQALTVCISPLQALMADQVADLEQNGLNFSTFINSTLTAEERSQRLAQIRNGDKGLLYISPEQLRSLSIRALLQERPPVFWVVDEAHCISQWGHDFRPDFRYIPKFIQELYEERQLPSPHLALFTATATHTVQTDIKELFAQHQLPIQQDVVADMNRENLNYQVVPVEGDRDQQLLKLVRQGLKSGGCVLVYTTTRKDAERLAMLLNQHEIQARHFHGKISRQDKEEVLQAFKQGKLDVVTATCAFGMGINRKDVRAVIHHTMSGSLEAYVQEGGRAGRDGLPATCTLLFSEPDADTIFFLKSLNQLSEPELRNLFLAIRVLRDRFFKENRKVTTDWFWVTADEVFHTSDLDEKFANDNEQRDTKIKVALHHLEQFGLVERAENSSSMIQFSLIPLCLSDAFSQFERYSRVNNLAPEQVKQFNRLINAMYRVQEQCENQEQPFSLERLSDESGIPIKEMSDCIRELQIAEICSYEIPVTVLLTKGGTGDALKQYDRLCQVENDLLEELLDLVGNSASIQINLRGLATRLDPDRSRKLSAPTLMSLLTSWQTLQWVKLQRISAYVVKLQQLEVIDCLEQHQDLCKKILEIFYQRIGKKTGARLRVEFDLDQVLQEVQQRIRPLVWTENDLKAALFYLHQQQILRLTDGLSLFQQSLKVKVMQKANVTTIHRRYPDIETHYQEQTRRTHAMIKYGEEPDGEKRQQLITDYFQLSPETFMQRYPDLTGDAIHRPVTQADYDRIMSPLNSTQRAIVEANEPAMVVIAGPGSGKTRTIVHRIAYLIKVKRVQPNRILVLAYNRNAVRELRLRLKDLIGPLASNLQVYTFHGLALSLLGCSLKRDSRRDNEKDFEQLLRQACALLEQGEIPDSSETPMNAEDGSGDRRSKEEIDSETQMRRVQLLGNLEYIFVDEYQDVAENEYRLIRLIAGLGQSEDKERSVQINLCVIGDDDQNIYEFRGTSSRYILAFETEYKAKRFLLTENYRSTAPIIAAANALILHNQQRCKRTPEEQVRINQERLGQAGESVRALRFNGVSAQAAWISQQVQSWLQQEVKRNEIAIIARKWDDLSQVRVLLEQQGIKTYALKNNDIKLVRHYVTYCLIEKLKAVGASRVLEQESVWERFHTFFRHLQRDEAEPTVQLLLKLAQALDEERNFGSEEVMPMGTDEILTEIFEFNQSDVGFTQDDAVAVTSCHSAKGLEFRKVILLTDERTTRADEIESQRRLFYVAMTRAKEELILCSTQKNTFIEETTVEIQPINVANQMLPRYPLYIDLSPKDVYLSHPQTQQEQKSIKRLREGELLVLRTNRWSNGWDIYTSARVMVGTLSKNANKNLQQQKIDPTTFQFHAGEVTVRSLYRHLKTDEVTGDILEDWFVVIPKIRICR
jgi:ATP-dependent DNA helicase RecQ